MAKVAAVHPIGITLRCHTCGERFPNDYAVCPKDATPLGLSEEPTDPLLGRVLAGSYRIIKLLAQGGMGRLYEAEHTRLPRRLAIKVIHDVYATHRDAIARFEREARASALIDSEHVVSVVDVVRADDDRPCIVYERLEGEDLSQRLRREGALPVGDAIEIARQMALGLAAAHGAGVVHRDLKPSNIFLAARPGARLSVKLLDFGVAKLIGAPDITRTGAVVGTPAYMAPEQARGAEGVDARSDIYGLGAVLYKMVSGRAPFDAADATTSLTSLLAGPPRPIAGLAKDIPVGLIRVIEDTMAREPSDRPSDAGRVATALDAVATSSTSLDPEAATRVSSVDATAANAEATAVMPRDTVVAAVRTRTARKRERPRAILDLALRGAISASLAASVLAALGAPRPAVLGVAAVLLAYVLFRGGRRVRRHWTDARALGARRARTKRAARVGFASLGVGLLGASTLAAFGVTALAGGIPLAVITLGAAATGLLAIRPRRRPRAQARRRTRAVPSSR